MKTLLLSGAIVLAVPSAALSAAFEPERVEEAATFDDLRAVVKALGHEVEAEDPRNQTLRAADANGTHYLLTGTACDVEGVPGCRGIVMQVLFEGTGDVTPERLAVANLNQVAVSTRFDPASNVVSVTRYVVLDKGVTMANIAENVGVLLALAPEVLAIVFEIEGDTDCPG